MTLWDRFKTTFTRRSEPTPEDVFTQEFMSEALKHTAVERVERSSGEKFTLLVWTWGADSPMQVYLGNIFQETRELSPEDKLARIRATLSVVDERDGALPWEEAREVLVPLVRMTSLRLAAPTKLVALPFLPFVQVYAGLDRGQTISYVNSEQVEEWAVDDAAVLAAAIATLSHHILESDVEPYDPAADYPIWHVCRDDSYQSSRIALPGFLASFRGKVEGNPLAIVPERSTLIISGDGNAGAIARLAGYAESEFLSAARPLSPAVYTVGASGDIEPLRLPSGHPHYYLVERGHRLLAATCYADQKEILEKEHERDGTDIFVATLGVFRHNDTGETTTWATMAEGVDTLLPEADLIALVEDDDNGWKGMVPWAKVFELAPECFEKDRALDPPRWRVVGWPKNVVMSSLRAAAVR